MAITEVQAALAAYQPALDANDLAKGEQERAIVLDEFPRDTWPGLALTKYAIGQVDSSHTYCRLLEYSSGHLGSLGGGSSAKLIIYKHKSKPGWYFDSRFSDVNTAWQEVRAAFIDAFDYGDTGDWTKIDDLAALSSGQALLTKSLHVYFAAEVLPVYSRAHLRHYLSLLDRPEADQQELGAIRLNRALLEGLRSVEGSEQLTTGQLVRMLYRHLPPPSAAKMWKVSPGEKADRWEECRVGNFVSIGWDDVGDLRDYGAKDDFASRFSEAYGDLYGGKPQVVGRKASELWRLRELSVGDLIVANNGKSEVLAVGKVIEPIYSFDETRDEYQHVVHVNWDESFARTIPTQNGWLNTIDKVSTEARGIILSGVGAPPPPPADVDDLYRLLDSALARRKQVVLYGPPGTGKTFHARRFASWWLLGGLEGGNTSSAALTDDAALRKAEGALSKSGRWTFVTFHPSYAYEDFVEGFRPVQDAGENTVSLALEDGVFKRVCESARQHPNDRYLLLIDEINRANVAKVFGELITLIEADKRGLRVTLPQSKESIDVPANVHLVGTMNTADRSITLLDVALRRRFAFLELMPDSSLVQNVLRMDELLDGLNRRLIDVAGREKQVGHAYFMPSGKVVTDVEDLASIFREEIVPLLQEYCYDEYEDLAALLGPKIVDVDQRTIRVDDAAALHEALVAHLIDGAN